MNTKTHKQQLKKKHTFCALQTEKELAYLLNVDLRTLQIIANQPRYSVFSVPKKDGKPRLIENPERALKTVQTKLNAYLQSVYYCEKSWASYGFVLNIRNDQDRRNILTNAKKHLGKDSGIIGYIWVVLLAGTTIGGLYVAFPVAHSLFKKGATLSVMFTYIGASAICRIPMTIFESSFMGIKFSLIRLIVSIPLVILSSVWLGNYLEKKNYSIMEGK